jgi:general secretion pathway protein I
MARFLSRRRLIGKEPEAGIKCVCTPCRLAASIKRKDSGFLLLETLIAFVIAALALGVVVGVAGSALQSAHLAARYQEAALRAQSHLEEAVNGNALSPGEWQGEEGAGFHWRLHVTQSSLAALHRAGSAASLTLYDVNVWIEWRDGLRLRNVHLETERIAEALRAP